MKGYDEAVELVNRIKWSRNKFDLYKENLRPIANLKQMLEESAELFANRPCFWQKFNKNEPFTPITYSKVLRDVNSLGTALLSRGMADKKIAVIGENCYHWALSYLAIACGVGVVVPLDKELNANELKQLVEQSGASCVLLSPKYRKMFKEMLDQGTGKLEFLVDFRADMSEDNVYALSDLLAEGSHLLDMGDRRYLDREIDPDVMGVLLFTSGTTGVAKGVMLSQKNLCAEIMLDPLLIKYTKEDIFFSVLPLHHTYECTCAFLVSVYRGSSIGYCQGLKYIQKDMAELKPTIFCGVPLIFESFRKSILKNVKKQGKERMFNFALRLNRAAGKLNLDLEGLLLSKVREVFGGRMRLIVMGGAPVKPELIDFYNDLGITAIQGYGLTECAPLVAAIPPDKKYFRTGSAGHILSQIEVEILNKNEEGIGEIAIKGPNVMMGYYNDPEATANCLIDGWFHTGDLGYLDKDGYIYITGRSKNVIITKNGKNVYPEELENYLDESLFISESMVWADSDVDGEDSVIIATIRPDMEEVENYLGDDAKDPEAVRALIQSEVDRINEPQPLFKKISKIVIKNDDFVKSTTHKIKRFEEENKGI